MKMLIDECVDERLRLSFHPHDCQTAGLPGWPDCSERRQAGCVT
jgi:hypothetical protein